MIRLIFVIISIIVPLFSSALAQRVESLLLTTYSGNGLTPETAFAPTVALKYGLNFEDITSVEQADSVNLVVVKAEYDQSLAASINSDTTCYVINRDPALNNRIQFNAFLARKKNGIRLRNAIALKSQVSLNDIILELRRIDREKRRP